MYYVKFADSAKRNFFEFRGYRNFQWTNTRNKDGKANFSLETTPASKKIRAGWSVKIFRDGKKVWFGKVYQRQVKLNSIKIFAGDPTYLLNRKQLYQRPVAYKEASTEVVFQLDGLDLGGGVVLSAGDYVHPTGTTLKWHWENNKYGDYIADIGQQVNNLSGDSNPYFFWIDSDLQVHFTEDGSEGYYKDLLLKNITMTEDTTDTYNNITVEGNPINTYPHNKDIFTESLMAFQPNSVEISLDFVTNPSNYGAYSLRSIHTYALYLENDIKLSLAIQGGLFNLENMTKLNFDFRIASSTVDYFFITFQDTAFDSKQYDAASLITGVDTWFSLSLDKSLFAGVGDWAIMNSLTFACLLSTAGGTVYYDNFRILTNPYSYTASDQASIDQYGEIDKKFLSRNFYSNAECQTYAETLLAYYKDPKLTFNASYDGFIDILPNSLIDFNFEDINYVKPMSSITHYVTVEGKESAQLTLGDFKKEVIDKILTKLIEINRNYGLLENPYKVV